MSENLLLAARILGAVIAVVAVFHIVLSVSKIKTFAKSIICLIAIYIIGFAMWILLYAATHSDYGFMDVVPEALFKSFKMFAFGNDKEAFYEIALYPGYDENFPEAIVKSYDMTLIFCRYVAQIGAFLVFSTAIVTNAFLNFSNWKNNFVKVFKSFFNRKGESSFSNTDNYVYTDLPFEEVEPFIEKLKLNGKSTIYLVILKTLVATQYGSELMESLRLNGYQVLNESVERFAFSKYCFAKHHKTVNFYSIFEKDSDNLKFANTAVSFLNNNDRGRRAMKRGNVNFFVSFQDENMNDRNDVVLKSNGRVRFINEYNWVASKFVFENPISRFVNCNPQTFNEYYENEKSFNIHFIGFGRVNRALAEKMLTVYQFPSENTHVNYHVIDIEGNELLNRFKSSYQCSHKMYEDENEFYPQPKFLDCFKGHDFDAHDDDALYAYAEEVVKEIDRCNNKETTNSSKNLIFVALGNKEDNVQIAIKLRQYIKNIAETYGPNTLKMGYDDVKLNKYKNVIIYPYVKDNKYFMQSFSLFEKLTELYMNGDYIGCKEDKVDINKLNYVDYLEMIDAVYDHRYTEIIKNKENYAKYEDLTEFATCFNSFRSYIFEVKSNGYFQHKFPKNLKKLGLKKLEVLLSEFRKAAFFEEECPVVVFGRGSYIGDELDEAILQLAKEVNRTYSGGTITAETMDKEWTKLSYPMQRANVEAVLCFPFRIGLLGYKFVWDKHRIVPQYIHAEMKKDKALMNKLEFINKRLIDNFKVTKDKNLLQDVVGFCSLKEALNKEGAPYVKYLSEGFKASLKDKELNADTVPTLFHDFYREVFDKYVKGDNSEEVINKVIDAVNDFYNLRFASKLNEKLISIRNMEHNRWYITTASTGAVPRSKQYVSYNIKDSKSKDRLRHLCLASNAGLEQYGKDVLSKMVKEGKIFYRDRLENEPNGIYGYRGERIEDFSFDIENDKVDAKLKIISNTFNIVFKNDILQYETIQNCLKDEVEDVINNKGKSSNKNFFVLVEKRKYGIKS